MKLKCLPTDFLVEELTSVVPRNGPFALYELRKQSLGTLEAVQAISQRWRIAPADISFGGLKDKHAVTCQYLTVADGPRRNLRQTNLELTYLGQVPAPFESADVRGNRFRLAVRDLTGGRADEAPQALPEAVRAGVPNYFDRQRFGSVGQSGEFVAEPGASGTSNARCGWLWLTPTGMIGRTTPGEGSVARTLGRLAGLLGGGP